MTCQEFLRKLRRYARKNGLQFGLEHRHGDHVKVSVGDRSAILPGQRGELKTGTFRGICKDLGITPRDV